MNLEKVIDSHKYSGNVRTIIYEDKSIFFHEESPRVSERLNCFHTKEPETIFWIKNYMNENSIFWDIGANIGQYGVLAAKLHNCKTYFIEPEPHNYSNVCLNILLNELIECEPISIGLSDKQGYNTISIKTNAGQSNNNIESTSRYNQNIWTDTIDGLVSKNFIAPTHLKIDVDGVELKIIKGATNTLKNVESILIEAEEKEEKELLEVLKDFKLVSKNKRSLPGLFNYIFVKY